VCVFGRGARQPDESTVQEDSHRLNKTTRVIYFLLVTVPAPGRRGPCVCEHLSDQCTVRWWVKLKRFTAKKSLTFDYEFDLCLIRTILDDWKISFENNL